MTAATLTSGQMPAPPKTSWLTLLAWGILLAVLAASWKGADMRPAALWNDSANMVEFGRGFFPPDFSDWRYYLQELVITLQIALWGTVLAIVCSIPLSLLMWKTPTRRRDSA